MNGQVTIPGSKNQAIKLAIQKKKAVAASAGGNRFEGGSNERKPKTIDALFSSDLDGMIWMADGDSLPIFAGQEIAKKVAENLSCYFISEDGILETKPVQYRPKPHERGAPMRIDLRLVIEHDKAIADLYENEYTTVILDEIFNNLIPFDAEWKPVSESKTAYELRAFELSAFEVTVAQFELFVHKTKYLTTAENEKVNGSIVRRLRKSIASNSEEFVNGINWRFDPRGHLLPDDEYNRPVVHVSWADANAFCKWLGERDPRYQWRLPTVGEWEKAAKCGRNEQFSWGNEKRPPARFGNFADLSLKLALDVNTQKVCSTENDGYSLTSPVGVFEPSRCGLYDLGGNVAEWCDFDVFEVNKEQGVKPYKGGSYYSEAGQCEIERTNERQASMPHPGIGFRVVRTRRF